MFEAKILADSINPSGSRLTTMCITYPRCIHSELMTHRLFSRNSASSRAIPMAKLIKRIEEEPFIPEHWGQNEKGMQASAELPAATQVVARQLWLRTHRMAVRVAKRLDKLGLHKQIGNRILEPWMWITVIVSATNYENFFHLRCHPDAEPHIRKIAVMMRDLYRNSAPLLLEYGQWHLPLTGFPGDEEWRHKHSLIELAPFCEFNLPEIVKLSVARCARVSYLTHDGRRDTAADFELHDRLYASGHFSPFEHAAVAADARVTSDWGNFSPTWLQYRKFLNNECIRKANYASSD